MQAQALNLPIPTGAIVLRGLKAQLNCMFRHVGCGN